MFNSTKTSGLDSLKFPVVNKAALFETSEHKDNLAKSVYPNFQKFHAGNSPSILFFSLNFQNVRLNGTPVKN